ncbi:PREDICTED: cytochrome P450 703A2-like, partial [Nicotiana attenuata]
RVEERQTLISQLNSLAGKPFFLKDHLSRFSLCSMTRMVLSNKYFGESTVRIEDLQRLVDQWFLLNGAFNNGDWIPWLSFLDLQGYVKQMKALKRTFDKFHNIVLDDHRAKKNEENNFVPKDMVDVLLKMAEDPNLEVKLTNDCVKGLMQDLLTGGTDSLTAAVQCAFQELLRQPRVIEKATEELDRVVGKERWVEEKDIDMDGHNFALARGERGVLAIALDLRLSEQR